jgi:uncharacterized lipoprotein YbaY
MKLLRTAGVLLLAGLATAACGGAEPSAAPEPTPASTAPTVDPAPTSTPTAGSGTSGRRVTLPAGAAGSDGLTVRHLDADGRTRTLRVEDFPR